MVVYKNTGKVITIIFTGLFLFVGMFNSFSSEAYADKGKSEIGIRFGNSDDGEEEKQGETPVPKDNTPKPEDGSKPIMKKMNLPNTGEIVKQLSFLVGLMLLIAISFTFILNKRSELK